MNGSLRDAVQLSEQMSAALEGAIRQGAIDLVENVRVGMRRSAPEDEGDFKRSIRAYGPQGPGASFDGDVTGEGPTAQEAMKEWQPPQQAGVESQTRYSVKLARGFSSQAGIDWPILVLREALLQ